MKYSDFERALSKPRIGRFLIAAKQDQEKALLIYRQNIELSKAIADSDDEGQWIEGYVAPGHLLRGVG